MYGLRLLEESSLLPQLTHSQIPVQQLIGVAPVTRASPTVALLFLTALLSYCFA